MEQAQCQCDEIVAEASVDEVAEALAAHIRTAHPGMQVPSVESISFNIRKHRGMYGRKGMTTFLLYPVTEEE